MTSLRHRLQKNQEECKERLQQLEDEMTCWKGKKDVLEQEIKQRQSHINELNVKIVTWQIMYIFPSSKPLNEYLD